MGLGLQGTKEKKPQEKCCPFLPVVIFSHCETLCAEIQYKDQMTFNNTVKNKNEAIQSRNGHIQHSLLCIMDMAWYLEIYRARRQH